MNAHYKSPHKSTVICPIHKLIAPLKIGECSRKYVVHRRFDTIIELGSFLAHSPIIDLKILKSILGKSNLNPFIIKTNVKPTFFCSFRCFYLLKIHHAALRGRSHLAFHRAFVLWYKQGDCSVLHCALCLCKNYLYFLANSIWNRWFIAESAINQPWESSQSLSTTVG